MFELHPQLRHDCRVIGRFPLCQLLLLNDARFPWFVLVPERERVAEIYMLSESERGQLWRESNQLSECIVQLFRPDKLNIAALGNIVPQLHVHHIARYTGDAAWPKPVWGVGIAQPYDVAALEQRIAQTAKWLAGSEGFAACAE